jgi:beta-lactam-binding protein with PASTA domain
MAQSPSPGVKVRKGATVTLSLPQPTNAVTVPNLANLSPSQAAAQLNQVNLTVGSQTQACSNSIPSGQVSGSSPSAGNSIARGSAVNLVISTGPCQVVVQNVVGQRQSDATSALQGQGLTVATSDTSSCDASANGNVVSQNPQAGTQVSLPATDTITVCSAPAGTTTTTTTTTTTLSGQ